MKICDKCRAQNADTRVFCLDCGTTLGEKLSDAQEAAYQDNLSDNIEALCNRNDPLYVSRFDKIVGVLALLGCAASVVLPFIRPYTMTDDHPYLWAFLFFTLAALDAFVPQLAWGLEKLRISLWADGAEGLQPGRAYLVGRRIGNAVVVALGALLLGATLLSA